MTKLSHKLIPVCVLVLLSPLAARAASIEPKSVEADARFTFQHTSVSAELPGGGDADFGVTIFDLQVGLGYFLTSRWEIAGDLLISHSSFDDFGESHFGLMGSAYYHFATTGEIIPFAGIGLGIMTNGGDGPNDETSIIIPELVGGIRWPFTEIISMNFTGGYRHRTNAYGFEDAGGHEFFLGFGVSFFTSGGVAQ